MQPKVGFMELFKVRFNECDPMGHLNNANYLTYLEQVAFDGAAASGFDRFTLVEKYGSLFVVRKHEITYVQPALENDWLLICSWGSEIRGARAWRHYTVSKVTGDPAELQEGRVAFSELPQIERRDTVVNAVTEFAFMNVTTGRPSRVPDEFINAFFEAE